ncbi:MAG TPA: hypothetical protein VIK99_11000 [Thermaerobacter sp.]
MFPLGFFIMVAGIYWAYRRREQPENLLLLSLIGWYLLGGFDFMRLPVGGLVGFVLLATRSHRVNYTSRVIAFGTGVAIYVLKLIEGP